MVSKLVRGLDLLSFKGVDLGNCLFFGTSGGFDRLVAVQAEGLVRSGLR